MEDKIMGQYYSLMEKGGYYSKSKRLKFYCEKYLFFGTSFKNKNVLDIGGGNGLYSFYAAISGAKHVRILEPEHDGSTFGIKQQFIEIKRLFNNPTNISFSNETFQSLDSKQKFDIIIFHDSINHIDEDKCKKINVESSAYNSYLELLSKITTLISVNGILIVSDCSRKNFFNSFGLKNPFVKTIEWEKHQTPNIWIELFEKLGFRKTRLSWPAFNMFGNLGRIFLGNPVASYFLTSYFILHFQYINSKNS